MLIWLGGGMCHVDTLDPKPVGDPESNKAGSAYPSIPTAIPGVRVCEHLERTAPLLDRGVLIRSLTHRFKIDHADSTNHVKTGRIPSGTVVYPSLGSLVAHQRDRRDGRFLEQLGFYDPKLDPPDIKLDLDRVDHWVSQGAQTSPTVRRLVNRVRKESQSA